LRPEAKSAFETAVETAGRLASGSSCWQHVLHDNSYPAAGTVTRQQQQGFTSSNHSHHAVVASQLCGDCDSKCYSTTQHMACGRCAAHSLHQVLITC
jgi:hypothetical protein